MAKNKIDFINSFSPDINIGGKKTFSEFDYNDFFKNKFHLGEHMLVLGATGTGKSNYLLNFYILCPHKTIFFNTIGLIEFNKASNLVLTEKDLDDLPEVLNNPRINKICITPSDATVNNEERMLDLWKNTCQNIYSHEDKLFTALMNDKQKVIGRDYLRRSNIVVVLDELMYLTEDERMIDQHKALLMRGRNYKISHIGASQRNQNIPKKICTQSFHKVLYNMEDFEITALKNKIAYVEMVRDLPLYTFIYYSRVERKPTLCKPVKLALES
jgi:energy-coupling factor transporter ATP-binding protein EcfA2